MKHIFINLLLLFFITANSQKPTINGNWLLSKINIKDKTENPYIILKFDNHKIFINDTDIGTYNFRKNELILSSDQIKPLNGKAEITELNTGKLIFKLNDAVYYFSSYNPEDIKKDSIYNLVLGVWQINGNDTTIFEFRKDNTVGQIVLMGDGMVGSTGQWLYIPTEKAIILQGDFGDFSKKSHIKNISPSYLEIENNGLNYQLERKKQINEPQHLSFTYEEIENNQGDSQDLPWSDEAMMGYWKEDGEIHYTYLNYEPIVHAFSDKEILIKVKTDEGKKKISFTYHLIKNKDTIKKGEKIKAPLMNSYNRFFPQKDIYPFRITNNFEIIKINGKEYDCTVVEGFDGDTKVKYWMINYMPGIFAKIIKEDEGGFLSPTYSIYKWNP